MYHLENITLVIASHYVQACKSYGINRKTMDRQRHMKTLPVHCMVSEISSHSVCMLCLQLCHKPTGFLVMFSRFYTTDFVLVHIIGYSIRLADCYQLLNIANMLN